MYIQCKPVGIHVTGTGNACVDAVLLLACRYFDPETVAVDIQRIASDLQAL